MFRYKATINLYKKLQFEFVLNSEHNIEASVDIMAACVDILEY